MIHKNSGQSSQTIRRRGRGRVTLREKILELLDGAKENMLTVRDFVKKLPVKREKVYPIKGGYEEEGFYASQFYKTLKDLEKEGKVRIVPKRVPGKVKFETAVVLVKELPAGLDEIKPILDNLKDPNEVVYKNAADDFRQLSLRKKVDITPEISKVLKEILSNESYERRDCILDGLFSILITAKKGDDTQTIEEIKENFLDILIEIASDNSADIRDRIRAIRLLGKLEVSEVLEPIFSIIANEDEKIFFRKLGNHLIDTLCFLYPTFGVEIRNRLYQLLKDEKTQERANFIFSNLRSRLGASNVHIEF